MHCAPQGTEEFEKVEPIAIITSCLPLAIAAFISIANFDTCKQTVYITSTIGEEKYAFIIWYSIVVVLCFIISILVVMIFIATIRRSQIHLQRQDDSEAESLLVTNNKWKMLSKQLLPLVAYSIVNTVLIAMIYFPLLVLYSIGSNFQAVYLYLLIRPSGLITGIIVIIHLCILKCKKKQKERKRIKKKGKEQESFCVIPNDHNDVFTKETVASTNAHTTYQYIHTSSFFMSEFPAN